MVSRSTLWSRGTSWLGKRALCICILAVVLVDCAEKEEKKDTEQGRLLGIGSLLNSLAGYNNNYNNGYNGYYGYNGNNEFNYNNNYYNQYNNYNNCPLCDVTVLSYCGDRLLHDACCCLPQQDLPRQCQYARCDFLHANSCREHGLITRCCCSRKNA